MFKLGCPKPNKGGSNNKDKKCTNKVFIYVIIKELPGNADLKT